MTGMEFLRSSTPEEIAEVIAFGHPPFCEGNEVECDRTTCKLCWLAWLTTGQKPKPTRELLRHTGEIPKRRKNR